MRQHYTFPRLPVLQTWPGLCMISSNNHTKPKYVHQHLRKTILLPRAELSNPFSDSPILLCLSLAAVGGEGEGGQRLLEATSLPPLCDSGGTWCSLSFLGEENVKTTNDTLLIGTGRRCSKSHPLWWPAKKAVVSARQKRPWSWGSQWKARG